MALNAIHKGLPDSLITDISGLSIEEIMKIRQNQQINEFNK